MIIYDDEPTESCLIEISIDSAKASESWFNQYVELLTAGNGSIDTETQKRIDAEAHDILFQLVNDGIVFSGEDTTEHSRH